MESNISYNICLPPKVVGYWWISGSPETGFGTKLAVYHNDKTQEQIEAIEKMFGWKWEIENGNI